MEKRRKVLAELHGRLWHTTLPDRFQQILKTGAILPEPNIPDADRWNTSGGSDSYPYVRKIGGVSLFDFCEFDPVEYQKACPMSTWHQFVPFQESCGSAIWIEIDRQKIAQNFISASKLGVQINIEGAHRHLRMPRIEAAHIGPLPSSAFVRAFLSCETDTEIEEINFDRT